MVGGMWWSSGLSVVARSTVEFSRASILNYIMLLGRKSRAMVAISVFVLKMMVFCWNGRRFSGR